MRLPSFRIDLSLSSLAGISILSVFLFLFGGGCESASPTPGALGQNQTLPKVHVAFSGGGWRAHTGHAGWIISLLGNGTRNLNNAFANVGTISSNSGGSWFSTMLMYSDAFDQKIQAQNALISWNTIGWLGQQRTLFQNAPACDVYPYPVCVADYYTNHHPLQWDSVIVDLVFRDYPLGGLPLNGARQPWAANKPLLLAATLLTNNVVLNISDFGDERYYQACISPAQPVFNEDDGSPCNTGTFADVSPVTFPSIPGGLNLQPPPFLRQLGMDSVFKMGYTEAALVDANTASMTLQNPFSTDQVPVAIAAAASSAAAGFVASYNVSENWMISYTGEDEALSFQLANGTVQHIGASGLSVNQLAQQKMVRIADGGTIDNTGVAQLVSFLQLNKQADNFNIVTFDNVQSAYTPTPGTNGAMVGIDIANLFGVGIPPGNEWCFDYNVPLIGKITRCVTLPNLQIFDSTAVKTTPVYFQSFTGSNGIICTKYSVTTVNNNVFGITGGTKGSLYAFTCVWPGANTAPESIADFDTYNQMMQFIYGSLQRNGGKGQQFLNAVFGLK